MQGIKALTGQMSLYLNGVIMQINGYLVTIILIIGMVVSEYFFYQKEIQIEQSKAIQEMPCNASTIVRNSAGEISITKNCPMGQK